VKSILFLCTGNSCRSQMAEGFCRHLRGDVLEPYSAGTVRRGLDPLAVRAMSEAGIDISGQHSKTLDEPDMPEFDYVVTVCGSADEACPFLPARLRRMHRGFDDPPGLAEDAADEEEAMDHYRRVRDEIREFVLTLPESMAD
jgi:arsenate reductase